MFLVERIARHLATHGACSTKDLAAALGEPAARIGDAVKAERNRARWGITKLERKDDHHSTGSPPNIWQINVRKFNKYLIERRDMPWIAKRVAANKPVKAAPLPKNKAPKANVKSPKVDYSRPAPTYNGPHLTAWQPSSPYYQGDRT